MNIKSLSQFRICMVAAIVFTCGLGTCIVIPIWVAGEYLNARGDNAAKKV